MAGKAPDVLEARWHIFPMHKEGSLCDVAETLVQKDLEANLGSMGGAI